MQLESVHHITAEVVCEPGDEDLIATQIAAIEGVRRVTATRISVLAAAPAPAPWTSNSAFTMTATASA